MKKIYFMLMGLFVFVSSTAQINVSLPLSADSWNNLQCGSVYQTSAGLRVQGAGHRIGANLHSLGFFDFRQNGEVYLIVVFNPSGYAVLNLGTSVYHKGITTQAIPGFQEGDTLYARLSFNSADSSATYRLAKGNFDNLGGQILIDTHQQLTSAIWGNLASSDVFIGFNDNYGGTSSSLTILSARVENVTPVDRTSEIHGIKRYGFENGSIPSVFNITGNTNDWQIIDTAAVQSVHALYANVPVHQENALQLNVSNAVKVTFDLKYDSETHKYMRFTVDNLSIGIFDSDDACWKHFEWQLPDNGTHQLEWKIFGSQYDVEPGQLWIDNIVIYTSDTTYTPIPDSNFENALTAYDDIQGDNQVPTLAIDTVTVLDVSSRQITDLTGIQDFHSLIKINARSNQISSVDLRKNYFLEWLLIDNNLLQNLDFHGNPHLTTLSVSSNQLTGLDLSPVPNLSYLACSYNNLTNLDVSHTTGLVYLYATYNQISSIDVTVLPSLFRLTLSGNPVSQLDVSQNPRLFQLELNRTPLTQIDISNNPNLQWFSAWESHLQNLDATANSQLSRINIRYIDSLQWVDLRNGNNTAVTEFHATSCPALTCIFVDDPAWWQQNFGNEIDSTAHFVANQAECDAVDVDKSPLDQVLIYPNPAANEIIIDTPVPVHYRIMSLSGQIIQEGHVEITRSVSLNNLKSGFYFLYLETNNGARKLTKFLKR